MLEGTDAALLNAAVIVSMALTPLAPALIKRLVRVDAQAMDGIETADGLSGTALVIGFGRFGQVASQALLARGHDVTIIDADTDMIRVAGRFGFKIYYGDGTRLDVLRAAGAGEAELIAVCVDGRADADHIVELVNSEFPLAQLFVRAYDRGHTLNLRRAGVAYEVRETFESAMAFGEAALRALGSTAEEAAAIIADVRQRDRDRLGLQQTEGLAAGRHLFKPTPIPLTPPKREARALSEETAVVATQGESQADEDPDPAAS